MTGSLRLIWSVSTVASDWALSWSRLKQPLAANRHLLSPRVHFVMSKRVSNLGQCFFSRCQRLCGVHFVTISIVVVF